MKVDGNIRDHRIPLNQGGSDDEDNEQLLCMLCHNIKIYRDGSRSKGGGV
jgi:5-methylcytosine-specific restriction endonuclease McrA